MLTEDRLSDAVNVAQAAAAVGMVPLAGLILELVAEVRQLKQKEKYDIELMQDLRIRCQEAIDACDTKPFVRLKC